MTWSGALANDPVADALSLVSQKRYGEAREVLEPMLEQEPDSLNVQLLHGVLLAREGQIAEAVAIFESLRNDHPAMFEAHNNLAVLYARLGRLDDARNALVAALELRSDAVVYANLGDVYMKLAERAYQRAHELRDNDSAVSDGSEQVVADSAPAETTGEPPAAAVVTDEEQGPATELGNSEESQRPAEPESVPAQAASAICVRAGWFREQAAADEAAEWLRSAGAEAVEVRDEEQQVVRNYQVYLPPASSREAAVALAGELRDKGVDDIWIIDSGTQINGISLGVYRNKRYMSRRVAELEKLGFPVTSTANMKTVTEYAVEARTTADHAALEEGWNAEFQEYAIRRVDCADRT